MTTTPTPEAPNDCDCCGWDDDGFQCEPTCSSKPPTPQLISASNRYAYHVQDPFKVQRPMHDKNGVLHFISWSQYLNDIKEPNNCWKLTKFEESMRVLAMGCMAFGFLLICFLIGQS